MKAFLSDKMGGVREGKEAGRRKWGMDGGGGWACYNGRLSFLILGSQLSSSILNSAGLFFDLTTGSLLSIHVLSFMCNCCQISDVPSWRMIFGPISMNTGGGYHLTHTLSFSHSHLGYWWLTHLWKKSWIYCSHTWWQFVSCFVDINIAHTVTAVQCWHE